MADVQLAPKTGWITALLMERQRAEGLDDTQFAAKLGISASLWARIKSGKIELGAKPTLGIAEHYPDIWAAYKNRQYGR